MIRFVYLIYYLKNLDYHTFKRWLSFVSLKTKTNVFSICLDIVLDVFKYNISILEYFQFRFYELNKEEKEKWAGTGFMYEYQLKMNPRDQRDVLNDKTKFYKAYKKFFIHNVADINDLKAHPDLLKTILNNPAGKLVFKIADGKCGFQVKILNSSDFNEQNLVPYMETNNFDLVEEFILQHPDLNKLSPTAVNTVRIFTQINNFNEVEILGCRQRISVNCSVDNMAAGNLAAPIDDLSGIITGPGVYSDITRHDETIHPSTGIKIIGFQIPFWDEVIKMVKNAALAYPQNRSIGWDIVVAENGPGLIEGNHDWCKLVWQLPVRKGLKSMISND